MYLTDDFAGFANYRLQEWKNVIFVSGPVQMNRDWMVAKGFLGNWRMSESDG